MFKNKFFLGVIALAILGILVYSLNTGSSKSATKDYLSERKSLDESLKNDKDSPVEDKSLFTGLKYYAPDSSFRLMADYQAVSDTEATNFMMTDGSKGELKKVMKATFALGGKTFTVGIFREGENFFLPFRDLTNGKQTYGGGRYINVAAANVKGNKIEIDFNDAHNFYCAYNHTYVCPMPPPENMIDVEIRAGEKNLK
jgi:uncharacterized protein